MASGATLSVVAVVMALDGGQATIDRGLVDGLLPADRGTSFYELVVDGVGHRIDSGVVTLEELRERDSSVAGSDLHVGSRVAFEIPAERIADRSLIAAARRHLPVAEADALVGRLLEGLVASDDPAVREALGLDSDPPEPTGASAPAGATAQAAVVAEPEMVRVPEGRYWIGAAADAAKFFNEQPRHRVRLDAFWIDREAIGPPEGTRSFAEAERFCAAQGKRLPTEQEWETAIRNRAAERSEVFEWTASPYAPYPGNRTPEDEYHRGYKVLRGDVDSDAFRPERRRFMAPKLERESVGFRCARSDG